MPIKVGINGFGRISRVIMRIAESRDDIEVVGINIRNADLEYLAYMLRYDSTFGRFPAEVEAIKDGIAIDGRKIAVYSESDASGPIAERNTLSKLQVHIQLRKKQWCTSNQVLKRSLYLHLQKIKRHLRL